MANDSSTKAAPRRRSRRTSRRDPATRSTAASYEKCLYYVPIRLVGQYTGAAAGRTTRRTHVNDLTGESRPPALYAAVSPVSLRPCRRPRGARRWGPVLRTATDSICERDCRPGPRRRWVLPARSRMRRDRAWAVWYPANPAPTITTRGRDIDL